MIHRFLLKILMIYCMLFPSLVVADPNDDEIIFDDDESKENNKPKDETEEDDTPPTPRAPVEQVVERTTDEQGLLRSMDEYDTHLPYEKMRKDIPKFHIDAALGPTIGMLGLSSHAGPIIQMAALWRTWRYFGWGAVFDAQFLMSKGVSRPGFAPAIIGKFFIPLRRRHYLTPQDSWEIGVQLASGYIEQGLMHNNLKWVANGVLLSIGLDLSYWYTPYIRFFGRMEWISPFWMDWCEESSALRHCETQKRFDGQMITFLAGVSFAIW